MSLLDTYLETLVKESSAEAQERSRFDGLSARELADIAGIKLAASSCPKCGAAMDKDGEILKCSCGMMKSAAMPFTGARVLKAPPVKHVVKKAPKSPPATSKTAAYVVNIKPPPISPAVRSAHILASLGLSAGIGAAVAPEGHRMSGAGRGVIGGTLGSLGGGLVGAAGGGALGTGIGALAGGAMGRPGMGALAGGALGTGLGAGVGSGLGSLYGAYRSGRAAGTNKLFGPPMAEKETTASAIRNPISDILSDPELKKLAKSWESKTKESVIDPGLSNRIHKLMAEGKELMAEGKSGGSKIKESVMAMPGAFASAGRATAQSASNVTSRLAGARQARLASQVPAQTAAQARAPVLTGAGGGELTAKEMSAARGPIGNMAAKVRGFFNKPMAPAATPVPAMGKVGSVAKKAFIVPAMIGASAAEPGREWEGAAKGFVGSQLGGLAGAAGGAALGAGGGALYHHLKGVEGHPDMKSYRYRGGKMTPSGSWKSGRMVSTPLRGSKALAAAKDIRNMRMLGGTAIGMLAGAIPGTLYGAYKGGRSARNPQPAEKTGSANTLELILEKLGFVSAAELARASARKLPTKMVGKAKGFKRPTAPKAEAKEPEYASLVRQFHKQGSPSVIQQILDKIAAAEDRMGSIELNPEDMREALEDAAAREDIEARGRKWGLGSGVAGGLMGVGAGAGLGRLLQSRIGPWGYAAAPLFGGAGALAGSRLGEAHGAEEALHDKLVEALRQRSAAQRGFMSGVEAGGYPFGQGR